MKQKYVWILALSLGFLGGCREETTVDVEFEPNLVFAYHVGQLSDQPMDQALAQTTHALTDLFGTPDDPKLPDFIVDEEPFASLVSLDYLKRASGPPDEAGRGLYRKHCAACHGITGNGRGPTAALTNPYPRDYRLGRFKFKSTPVGTKPTKQDLAYLIRNGIPGTTMVKIDDLSDQDVDALVDYVVYLSWRGEVERNLLYLAGEMDFTDPEQPDSIYTPALKESENEDDRELFAEQYGYIQEFVAGIAESWLMAPERVKEIPQRDPAIVPDTFEELLAAAASSDPSPVKDSIARGKELFLSEKAACTKCHGKEGRGDGQANDYDDWSNEWTKKFGLDPEAVDKHIPLIARGALPIRKVSPRNFSEGVYRGGRKPEQLYQRIALGIEGTPMPSAAVEPQEIWDIVNFVRSLAVSEANAAPPSEN